MKTSMAEFLTTQGTSYYLENIIVNANKWLVLISPYLNISENFMARLHDADKRKVQIFLVYGKDELKEREKQKLGELENLSLRYHKNLHAKCYLNESMMIITSMNMHEFSEKTNREMGVLVRNDVDGQIYASALKEVHSILDSAEETRAQPAGRGTREATVDSQPAPRRRSATIGSLDVDHQRILDRSASRSPGGHCIRCGREINLHPERPYCSECYTIWTAWYNPSYTEHYCHWCGKPDKSSMLYPLCRNCYQKSLR